jgi:REP element-mobilizing transposase RayT
MPSKNRLKTYIANSYYHVYNRGVEKRDIFQDEADYGVFLSYLKEYLEPKEQANLQEQLEKTTYYDRDKIVKKIRMNNFSSEIILIAFCLMPNHYHLLVKQNNERSLEKFMKSLFTRYTGYFNKRNKRVGTLFQEYIKV